MPTLRLGDAGIARGVQNLALTDRGQRFRPDEPIMLVTKVESATPGLVFRVRWKRGQELVQEDTTVLTGGFQLITLPLRDEHQHPQGQYHAVLGASDEPIGDLSFEIGEPSPDEPIVSFGEGDIRPRLLTEGPAQPPVPQEWVENGRDGLAIVRCTLTIEGKAEDCLIYRPVWFTGRSILRWLSEQHWAPATRAGVPVNARYVFNFRLRKAP